MKTLEFRSLDEFLVAASANTNKSKAARQPGAPPWCGGVTFEQAVHLARVGWPDGAAKVASLAAEVGDAAGGLVERSTASISYGVSGLWVDVGRLVTGEPECCAAYDTTESVCVQKVVVNVSANAGVDPDSLLSAGAAVLAAVDACESVGRRCELWIGSGSVRFGDKATLQVLVPVKAADQHVDVDRLAFLLCHASTLRRLMFSVEEDAGFPPGNCKTHPLDVPDAVVTPEVSRDSSIKARQETVAEICRVLGVDGLAEAATLTQNWSE